MRALYIGYNSTYINSQKELILSVFSALTELTFYGPGYSNSDNLETGILKWVEKQEKFDLVILDSGFVSFNINLPSQYYINYFKKSLNDVLHFNPSDISKYGKEYQSFFMNSDAHKFVFTTWDPYDTSKSIINFLIKSDTFVIDIFGDKLSEYNQKLKEESIFKDFFKSTFNDNWINFENNFKHKVISFPHAIFASDFSQIPLEKRKYKFNVIGVLYPERKQVIPLLTNKAKGKLFFKRVKDFIFHKLKLKPNHKNLKKKKENYQYLIENSKFCYVSGSPLRYPVRKYFEVPSKRTIPIGWACNGFENLGFKHGINFIVAENKDTLHKYLSHKDDLMLDNIAKNAQKLVFDKHSDYARISQLSISLKLIMKNKFKGSYWEDGIYKHY